ncbi:root hair defective 3-like protein, partial [Tanacetum coccineum]
VCGTLISALVHLVTTRWLMDTVPNICERALLPPGSLWTCPGAFKNRVKTYFIKYRKATGLHMEQTPIIAGKRFTSLFNHDNDSIARVWTRKEGVRTITKTAQSSLLKLLSVLAAIRLDVDAGKIGDTLVLASVDQ